MVYTSLLVLIDAVYWFKFFASLQFLDIDMNLEKSIAPYTRQHVEMWTEQQMWVS